jgi:four helix bundle protein
MTEKINSYKDLKVWVKGMDIVDETYRLTKAFPKDEMFALTSQMKRSSVSIVSNIAEGWGRESEKSFTHFLRISRASLYELETQLEIAIRQNLLKEENGELLKICW